VGKKILRGGVDAKEGGGGVLRRTSSSCRPKKKGKTGWNVHWSLCKITKGVYPQKKREKAGATFPNFRGGRKSFLSTPRGKSMGEKGGDLCLPLGVF